MMNSSLKVAKSAITIIGVKDLINLIRIRFELKRYRSINFWIVSAHHLNPTKSN